MPRMARIAPTTTTMTPIVQIMATLAMNPIMRRTTPRMIIGAPSRVVQVRPGRGRCPVHLGQALRLRPAQDAGQQVLFFLGVQGGSPCGEETMLRIRSGGRTASGGGTAATGTCRTSCLCRHTYAQEVVISPPGRPCPATLPQPASLAGRLVSQCSEQRREAGVVVAAYAATTVPGVARRTGLT